MCQLGQSEIYHCARSEKEELHRRYEDFRAGKIHISDFDLQIMAVRMIMLREQL